jgi:hypothetical protein
MRKTREILRCLWLLKQSHRQAAACTGMSAGTVGHTVQRARAAGLDWLTVDALGDDELQRRLYGSPVTPGTERVEPDCSWIHQERHRPGVTLELLHLEYLERYPEGLRYTAFCERYRAGWGDTGSRCGRRTLPARRPSSTTPARSRVSSTR